MFKNRQSSLKNCKLRIVREFIHVYNRCQPTNYKSCHLKLFFESVEFKSLYINYQDRPTTYKHHVILKINKASFTQKQWRHQKVSETKN